MSTFDDWYGILTPYYDGWEDDDEEYEYEYEYEYEDEDEDEYDSSEEDDWEEIQFLIDRIIKRRQKEGRSHERLRRIRR